MTPAVIDAPAYAAPSPVGLARPAPAPAPVPEIEHATPPAARARALRPAPLLVAYTSAHLAPGPLRVAELLSRRDRVRAHVAAVLPPAAGHPAVLGPEDVRALHVGRTLLRRREVRRQVHATVGRAAWIGTSVHEGATERTLARLAGERGAAFVLVGLDDPGAPERMASERGMLQLTRLSTAPVVGIPRGAASVPSRALVAMDGSAASERAARAAARLMSRGARITLAHVVPATDDDVGPHEPIRTLRGGCSARDLESIARELRAATGAVVETIWLEGDPADALLAFADRRSIDLLACGTSVSASAPWHPMAGTAAALLRGARHAVLVARTPERPA